MPLLETLFGSRGQLQQLPRLTPQQQQLQSQALGAFPGIFERLQQPLDIEPLLQQRRTAFQQETIPSLAERFTALGGGQRSSAFQGAIGRAGAGLEENLAGMQTQAQMQDLARQQGLLGLLSQLGMQPSFETYYQPGTGGFFGGVAPFLGQALGLSSMTGLGNLLSLLGGRQL